MKRFIRFLKFFIFLLIVAAVGAGVYFFQNSYQASETAEALLSAPDPKSKVEILDIPQGLLLDGKGTEDALIFYPGANVEYTAYLPLLQQLAEDGIDCFLIKMPANLALLGKNKADWLISHNTYSSWYIGGHSLGGYAASRYASSKGEKLKGLVMLAAYPTKKLGENLKVLEVYGSEDLILNRDKLEKGKEYLPQNAVVKELDGGNHAQFGDYGEQWKDGTAKISAGEQQEETAKLIEEMVFSKGE